MICFHDLGPPHGEIDSDDLVISDMNHGGSEALVLPHVRGMGANCSRLDGPERTQIIHDLLKVVDVEDILVASELVPVLEAWGAGVYHICPYTSPRSA